jgi:Ras family protein B
MANVELKWAKEVKHFCKNVPMILVANKIDIRTDQELLKELETDHIVSIFT